MQTQGTRTTFERKHARAAAATRDTRSKPGHAPVPNDEAAAGSGAMRLDAEQQSSLKAAFEALAEGSHRAFEDRLWLGFGDHWYPFRQRLADHGYIAIHAEDVPKITSHGMSLLGRLREATQATGAA
ncbi:MAG: hypothetical protein AAF747_08495 [Planctomycetota bacterium]